MEDGIYKIKGIAFGKRYVLLWTSRGILFLTGELPGEPECCAHQLHPSARLRWFCERLASLANIDADEDDRIAPESIDREIAERVINMIGPIR